MTNPVETSTSSFYRQRRAVSNLLDTAEREYYQDKLFQNKTNYKEVYNICNGLLGRNKVSPLLDTSLPWQLADQFNDYFTNKIILICEKLFSTISDLEQAGLTKPSEDQLCSETDNIQLPEFRRVFEKDIINNVIKSPTTHCDLDPIPTSLLKDILKLIAPLLQEITKKSITSGVFPQDYKEVLVNPFIKKIILDHLNNFFWILTSGMGGCRPTSVIPRYLQHHGTKPISIQNQP